jgi:hypothetical protein
MNINAAERKNEINTFEGWFPRDAYGKSRCSRMFKTVDI